MSWKKRISVQKNSPIVYSAPMMREKQRASTVETFGTKSTIRMEFATAASRKIFLASQSSPDAPPREGE